MEDNEKKIVNNKLADEKRSSLAEVSSCNDNTTSQNNNQPVTQQAKLASTALSTIGADSEKSAAGPAVGTSVATKADHSHRKVSTKGSLASDCSDRAVESDAVKKMTAPSRPPRVNDQGKARLEPRCSIDSRVEAVSMAEDNASLASRTSRGSRFMRRVSFRRSRAAAWLSAKLRKHQKGTDLSAAFNLLDQENKGVLVDLNRASEEELMTVSGISRVIARSIVEYRSAIGGFRQLQDLALVSGIGAARMATLCRDLTIREGGDDESNRSPSPDSSSPQPSASPPSIASAPTPSPHSTKLPYSLQPTSTSQPSTSLPGSHLSTPVRSSLSSFSSALPATPSAPPSSGSPLRRVNLNTASIFELMTVPGLNQEMAANIVHHREKRGPFRTVDDVCKVRGMRPKLTRHLHPHLAVTASGASCVSINTTSSNGCVTFPPTLQSSAAGSNSGTPGASKGSSNPSGGGGGITSRQLYRTRLQGHRRTLSAPSNNNGAASRLGVLPPNVLIQNTFLTEDDTEEASNPPANCADPSSSSSSKHLDSPVKSNHRLSIEFSSDVYELLSLRSERPEIDGLFENSHAGRSALRLATWNLCKLTPDKLSNPGVMEVVCRTILERGLCVLAVQDLLASNLLEKVTVELNTGSLRRVREWPGKRGHWAYVQSPTPVSSYTLSKHGLTSSKCPEYVGYLYNRRYVQLVGEAATLDCGVSHAFVSRPHIATFKAGEMSFSMANVHAKQQHLICRSESFLQSATDLHNSLSARVSMGEGGIFDDGSTPTTPTAVGGELLDLQKSTKNLQNGLIKDSILGSNGGFEGAADTAKRRLNFNGNPDGVPSSGGSVAATSLEEELRCVAEQLHQRLSETGAAVIVGDFGVPPTSEGVSPLCSAGYRSLLDEEACTELGSSCGSSSVPPAALNTDNLWLSDQLHRVTYTGVCSVVTEGLSHLAIPRGWGWGGLATTHCPVYADLYTDTALH